MESKEEWETQGHTMGNFHNYYSFNPVERRISLLPDDFSEILLPKGGPLEHNLIVMDIGCNAGDLTIALYTLLREKVPESMAIHMIGVDIDGVLIGRAKSKVVTLKAGKDSFQFYQADMISAEDREKIDVHIRNLGRESLTLDLITCFSTTMWYNNFSLCYKVMKNLIFDRITYIYKDTPLVR
jgi:SAM-dependent methyltransferase